MVHGWLPVSRGQHDLVQCVSKHFSCAGPEQYRQALDCEPSFCPAGCDEPICVSCAVDVRAESGTVEHVPVWAA